MNETLPTTVRIQELNIYLNELRKALPEMLHQPFWQHRVTGAEKTEYIRELSRVKRMLFTTVETQYPELKGKSYTVSNAEIKYYPYEQSEEE